MNGKAKLLVPAMKMYAEMVV